MLGIVSVTKNKKNNKKATVAFVPVVHAGYISFFNKQGGDFYVLGKTFIKGFPRLERDIRAVNPAIIASALSVIFKKIVKVLEVKDLKEFQNKYTNVFMPDEDISIDVAQKITGVNIKFKPSFLRWDKKITDVEFEIPPHRVITSDQLAKEMINMAKEEAIKSPDWWRQIGAVLARDGNILIKSHNRHLPHPRVQDALGDPRLNFDAGERPDTYLSVHSEIGILTEAARKGISVSGSDLFVTTFPCGNCARALSISGIKRLYYSSGYSRLDAEPILRGAGIEIILVK